MGVFQRIINGRQIPGFGSGTRNRSDHISNAVIVIGMMTWLLPPTVRAQKTAVVTTIRMTMEAGHEMVGIPCQINGAQRQYICVIDSGATFTVISDRVVKPDGPIIDLTTGNGVVRAHQREVSLTIADGLELKSKALVQSKMLQGVDILLGQDVLRQFKYVTFDFENRKVEFQR
ncbi:MAG TPA: retropepsin-like aspartic protease [Candidatus Acidoferrales bacterium]|jgi:hypothetical protein|nr:retropepsin-like aspartic protease [Candidatus Acidoferrales bacterium]